MSRETEDVAIRFGVNLARCRRLARMSQDELSRRASVHRTEVSQLERGLRCPRIDTLVKIAKSIEASFDDLLQGIDWTPGGETRPGRFVESSAPLSVEG